MGGCCSPGTYGAFFDEKQAARDARRYRSKGVDTATGKLVELVAERGVEGADVLEIGGGIGALQLELVARGAARATNVELSPAYETVARELLRERGLDDRVERRVVDVAREPEAVETADIVLLHRVVCCYPDYQLLLSSAAAKARRLLAFSFPPDNVAARILMPLLNLYPRVRGCDFRSYIHPQWAMLGVVERHGLRLSGRARSGVWRIAVLERA